MGEMSARETTGDFAGASDSSNGSTATEWGRDGENTPVYAVVSAVADAAGEDPFELPPLAGAIDPEALNDLFASRSASGVDAVAFRYYGYEIVVRGSGTVQVTEA